MIHRVCVCVFVVLNVQYESSTLYIIYIYMVSDIYVFKTSHKQPWRRGAKKSLGVPGHLTIKQQKRVWRREEREGNQAAATAIPVGFSSAGAILLQAASTTFDLDGSGSAGRSEGGGGGA
jgi:hypothetical protein